MTTSDVEGREVRAGDAGTRGSETRRSASFARMAGTWEQLWQERNRSPGLDASRRRRDMHELLPLFDDAIAVAAANMKWSGIETTELMAEGRLGFLEAAKRWQAKRASFSRESTFAAYARCWVEASMALAAVRRRNMVRGPAAVLSAQLAARLRDARPNVAFQLRDLLLRHAMDAENPTEAYSELDAPTDALDHVGRATKRAETVGRGWHGYVTETRDASADPERSVATSEQYKLVRRLLLTHWSQLSGCERFVMRERYLSWRPLSREETATRMALTVDAIEEIERGAIDKVRGEVTRFTTRAAP